MDFVHIELKRDTWLGGQATDQTSAVTEIRNIIENMDKEMLISLNLASDGTIINASICSIGTMTQSLVSVSDILRTAIVSGAVSIILFHNHPSGNPEASSADLNITKKLAISCQLMDLELLDHIVIGSENRHYSIRAFHKECFIVNASEYEQLLIAEI